jgi:hypothetical protein
VPDRGRQPLPASSILCAAKIIFDYYLKNFVVYLRLLHLADAKRSRKRSPSKESQEPNFEALRLLMLPMNRS